MSTILTVRDVAKSFGDVKAVDGVSFGIRRGTIAGLLGRNGAGKTTTLRMINGVFFPDRGEISLFGGSVAAARDRVGYLPEERGLYRKMKVLELLLFLAEIKGRAGASMKGAAETWLKRFELWDRRDVKLEELSKGNQQKVQLVGALLHDPEVLILDEPMSGLDPVNVVLVRKLLQELKAEGRTILLSTHQMAEAEKLAEEIILIHRGRVVLDGSLAEVRASSGRNAVHLDFEGDGGFLTALAGVAGGRVDTNRAELTLAADADPQALLRSAMERLAVRRFEVVAPSLEEIFIEKVGESTLEAERTAAA
ncbi:MAG TPA: ATP-binding cassette domain-containing protein [Thermoanaerobaculia bacterium]|nr:ATP-binding cassette domain-containing protein [Thermoanaerobaculia bacterium]HQR68107.1 ATP-binding cassette domain-containing protein [Thermoanaerobaculia bacterium]